MEDPINNNAVHIGSMNTQYKAMQNTEKSRQNEITREAHYGKMTSQSTINKTINQTTLRNYDSPKLDQTYTAKQTKIDLSSCTEIFLYSNDNKQAIICQEYSVNQMVLIYDDDDFSEKEIKLNHMSPNNQRQRMHKQFSSKTQFGRTDSLEKAQALIDGPKELTRYESQQQPSITPQTTKMRKHIGQIMDNKSAGNLHQKLNSKGNLVIQKMGTSAKIIPSTYNLNNLIIEKNNFYSNSQIANGSSNGEMSPVKSRTQNYNMEFKSNNAINSNNLMYIPNSPYTKNNVVIPGTQPLQSSKARLASAARAQSSSRPESKNKRSVLPNSIISKRNINGYREIKSRASRFNLAKDEESIYHSFATILSTFDEETMKDMVDCLVKDARDIQTNTTSHSQYL